jgi:hypothetical protein
MGEMVGLQFGKSAGDYGGNVEKMGEIGINVWKDKNAIVTTFLPISSNFSRCEIVRRRNAEKSAQMGNRKKQRSGGIA